VFVDQVKVHLRSGDGGAGVSSFHRVRGRPRGKPEGGAGGRGGGVVVVADESVSSLLDYKRRPHRSADSGAHGKGDLRHGRQGEDLILGVPVGTVVSDSRGVTLADLARPGQRTSLLAGGRGGKGNAALSGPRHVAPDFSEQGEWGEEGEFVFELKLLADAALIGYPNAGKSTLISSVSAARPKIADYPFTTLEPNLGIVEVDGRQFTLADIPGLIEGAAGGKGLGHAFLRHAERARALVILLDPSPLQEVPCERQLQVLRSELLEHSEALAERPEVVAMNKVDLGEGARSALESLHTAGEVVHGVSAATGEGVERLMHSVADAVDEAVRTLPAGDGYVLHRPAPPGFEVRRSGDHWEVTGRLAERAVSLDDLTKPEAADLAARRLARGGVEAALRSAGARQGDEVRIGEIVFEFLDEGEPGEAGL